MFKNFTRLIIFIFIAVLQTTFFQYISINSISPNIFIITVVSLSALMGRKEGIMYGILFGLVQDIFYGNVVGFYVLIYASIGFLAGYLYRNYYMESVLIPLTLMGVADLVYNLCIFIFSYLFRGRVSIGYYLGRIILPEITYTIVVGVVLYRLYFMYSYWIRGFEHGDKKSEDDLNHDNS